MFSHELRATVFHAATQGYVLDASFSCLQSLNGSPLPIKILASEWGMEHSFD